jgi:RHS repeat-associated protein
MLGYLTEGGGDCSVNWEERGKFAGAIANSYGFALNRSRETYSELSFFRNRWYDAKTGRFTQEDPIGFAGGSNLYAYAGNNPASYTDPFGLCPTCENEATLAIQVAGVQGRSGRDVAVLIGAGLTAAGAGAAILAASSASALSLAPTLLSRAHDIHGAVSAATQSRTTVAAARVLTASGAVQTWIASSERALRPAQRALLNAGERAITGVGHAETTIIEAARAAGATVQAIAASRPVCPACVEAIRGVGAAITSVVK